jgi:hypothetical protein
MGVPFSIPASKGKCFQQSSLVIIESKRVAACAQNRIAAVVAELVTHEVAVFHQHGRVKIRRGMHPQFDQGGYY